MTQFRLSNVAKRRGVRAVVYDPCRAEFLGMAHFRNARVLAKVLDQFGFWKLKGAK